MKTVMISIKPKWVAKIASGEKTIEVRKTRPKIDTPFKCYLYCTKGDNLIYLKNSNLKNKYCINNFAYGCNVGYANGKVIGHFVCDRIDYVRNYGDCVDYYDCVASCMSASEIIDYATDKNGNFVYTYGWHISDLVIYDEPKELWEFWAYNAELNKLFNEGEDCCAWGRCETENGCSNDCDTENILHCYQCWEDWNGWCHRLTRPPQSWCYVEEKE